MKEEIDSLKTTKIEDLNTDNSIFRYVPDNIGDIVFCDTSNKKSGPNSKEKTRKQAILSIIIPIVIAAFCWLVFRNHIVLDSIVSVLMLITMIYCLYCCFTFDGNDYFVGTEGFSIISFKDSRDNIVKKQEAFYENIEDTTTFGTDKYEDNVYKGTTLDYKVYGKKVYGERKLLLSLTVKYDKDILSVEEHQNVLYRFYKALEQTWSNYKFERIVEDFEKGYPVSFNVYGKTVQDDYIVFQESHLIIGGTLYDSRNIKNMYISDGYLYVENVNHSTKLLGLVNRGDFACIPIGIIANRQIFLLFFQHFKENIK